MANEIYVKLTTLDRPDKPLNDNDLTFVSQLGSTNTSVAITLETLRDHLERNTAYATVSAGLQATTNTQLFFVYANSKKTTVNGYYNRAGVAEPLTDENGIKQEFITGAALSTLSAIDGQSLVGNGNYSGIRTYTGTASQINCAGREAGRDGGEGTFFLDTADTTTVDDGGIVLVDGKNRRWKRQFTGPVDIRWYCKYDGVTDDSVGFQKAVNSGYKIFFPAGILRYTMTINLTNFAGIVGCGSRGKPGNQLSILWFDSATQNAVSLEATSATCMAEISDVQFRGNGSDKATNQFAYCTDRAITGAGGISIGIKFSRVFFSKWSGGGVLLSDQWFNDFDSCYFIECGSRTLTDFTGGIVFRPGGTLGGWAGSGNLIERCYFASSGYGIYNDSSWLMTLVNCIFEWLTTPWLVNGAGHEFAEINCWYENNTTPPVNVRGGFYVPGRGRDKVSVTASDTSLMAVAISDMGFDAYRDAKDGKSFLQMDGNRGVKMVHGSTPNTGTDFLDIGATTATYDSSNTTYPRRGASLSTYGSFYSVLSQDDAYSEKFRIAEVMTGAERSSGGNGNALGFIGFRTGGHAWSSAPLGSSTIATRWKIDYQGTFSPYADNAYSFGTSALRIKEIFAATGTINTSDRKFKCDEESITEKEKQVALKIKSLIHKFKFKDAVEIKGEKARIHFGVIAQEVEAAFTEAGLSAEDYGLWCYNEWYSVDGQPVDAAAVVDGIYTEVDYVNSAGEVVDPTECENAVGVKTEHEAVLNSRLGIRYDELAMFILAAI